MKKALIAIVLLVACGQPDPPPPVAVSLPPRTGTCPRAFGLVSSDYASSSIAVLSQDGTVLSGTILSSAGVATGASAPLSGDAVLPRDLGPAGAGLMYAIDRYPNAVVTSVAFDTARVSAQRSVATGFASNPYDMVLLDDGRAWVARYGVNPKAGREPYDGGSDVLEIDASTLAIRGRIDVPASSGIPARPSRLLRSGELVLALLDRMDASFKNGADGAIAALDPKTNAVAFTTELGGVKNCLAFASSQDGKSVAVACSGVFANAATQLDESDVVVVDATARPMVVKTRIAVAKPLGAPVASALAFDGERIVGIAYGETGKRGDAVFAIVPGKDVQVIASASAPFVFGDVVCSPCSSTCLVTDAEQGVVRRLRWSGARYEELAPTRVAGAGGLPPRTFGAF